MSDYYKETDYKDELESNGWKCLKMIEPHQNRYIIRKNGIRMETLVSADMISMFRGDKTIIDNMSWCKLYDRVKEQCKME